MKAVRLWCAILATMVAFLGVFSIAEFGSHPGPPLSAAAREALFAWQANPTPENEAIAEERRKADYEEYDHRWYIEIAPLLIFSAAVSAIWIVWWLAGREKIDHPIF